MLSLDGRACIVTGGASGLGLEIANQLLADQAVVSIFDKDAHQLELLAGRERINTYNCDVTNEEQVEHTVCQVYRQLGKIDVLVNNVGILYSCPLISLRNGGVQKHESSTWGQVLATNLTSAFYTTKHVVETMLRGRTKGIIVNISSVSARGNAGQSAYSAAKAGLEALTKVWAKELGPMGIRCFAVAPGFCDTESTHGAINEAVLKETISRVPVKRLGKAHEIASFVVNGIKNDFLTGKVLEIDGGLVI